MFNKVRNVRKRWFVVTAAVALLAIGLTSGAVFAASAPTGEFSHALSVGLGHSDDADRSQVMARVAEILGVEQADLEGAFQTALHEQANVRFADYAASLVTNTAITQEQADAAIAWFNAHPSETGKLASLAVSGAGADKVDALLSRMVTAEKLTQEQADAISAWRSDRPDALPERAGKHFKKGRLGHHDGNRHSDRGFWRHKHHDGNTDSESDSAGSAG